MKDESKEFDSEIRRCIQTATTEFEHTYSVFISCEAKLTQLVLSIRGLTRPRGIELTADIERKMEQFTGRPRRRKAQKPEPRNAVAPQPDPPMHQDIWMQHGQCKCQGDDPIMHIHYQEPPHICARCHSCFAYRREDQDI